MPIEKRKPDPIVKHLKQAWSLTHRIRAGENVEEDKIRLNRYLYVVFQARRKAIRRADIAQRPRSTNPEATVVARGMLADLSTARDLATILGHPADAGLGDEGAFLVRRLKVEITQAGDGFDLKLEGKPAGRFASRDDAQGFANYTEANLTNRAMTMPDVGVASGDWDTDERTRWSRYTLWGKLLMVLMDWA